MNLFYVRFVERLAQASCLRRMAILTTSLALLVAAAPAGATTYTLNPGNDISPTISLMVPGDMLILNPGNYSKTIRITNKNGNPSAWFTIRGAPTGTPHILATGMNNMVEIKNSSYWRMENLELDGRNGGGAWTGSDGIKAAVSTGTPDNDYYHHFVFENLYIHHFYNNCFSSHVTGWDITIRNCHFSDAQEVGLYMGNSDGYKPIMNFIFERNLVERTGNYNMELKAQYTRIGVATGTLPGLEFDTWGWLIKDNVWMRDNATADASRPNFLIDAAPMSGVGNDDMATIEGNVVLANCTNSLIEAGFQLSGNLIVRNNIIMQIEGSGYSSIRIGQHQTIYPRYLELVNNTVFTLGGSTDSRCLSLFDLQSGYTQIIANNAFIRGNTAATAVNANLLADTIVTNNIVRGSGATRGMTTINSTPLSQIFTNPVETPGLANLYPAAGSPLIDAGSNTYAAAVDFSGVGRPQGLAADVGAYERYGSNNPGWQLDIGLKDLTITGDLDGDGHVDVIDLLIFADSWGTVSGEPTYSLACDFNRDGSVDVVDLLTFADSWEL